MPLKDGDYRKLTEEEIKEQLVDALKDELDTTANPGDLVTKQLEAEARTLAQNQEEALQRVYKAAYLADATGKELDKVVDLIGVDRRDATSATGVMRMWRETPPTANYTIPSGSVVQTGGSDVLEFSTQEKNRLAYVDGFENNDLNNWTGDTATFSTVSTTAMTGNYAMQVPASSGAQVTSKSTNFKVGTKFNLDYKPNAGAVTAFRFALQDQSNYIEATLDEAAQDIKLELVVDGSVVSSAVNSSANIPTSSSHLEIEWGLYEDTKATLYDSKSRSTKLCSVTLAENKEWEGGAFSVVSQDGSYTALVDEVSTRSVMVEVQAIGDGTETNLGPDTITVMKSGISGVEDVTNPKQTGNPNLQDTSFSPLILGKDRETDEELRERAFNNTSIGGSATVSAMETAVNGVEGVQALTLNRNREDTSVDGLPAHSFEVIVYGGSDKDVAQAIFDTASIDSHDVGGVNGNKATYNITSEVTGQDETIAWSRPYTLDLNITVDLIVDDTFVGETDVQSIITNYVGGTDSDGSFVSGLDVGEDVYEAVLQRRLVSPGETGVWEVDSITIDKNGDGTDDTTTATSGADILAVADNEVAITNARDGSITVNTTQK